MNLSELKCLVRVSTIYYILFRMDRDRHKFDFGLVINGTVKSCTLKTTLCSVVVLDMKREECDLYCAYLDIVISSSRCVNRQQCSPQKHNTQNLYICFFLFHCVFRLYILTIIRQNTGTGGKALQKRKIRSTFPSVPVFFYPMMINMCDRNM